MMSCQNTLSRRKVHFLSVRAVIGDEIRTDETDMAFFREHQGVLHSGNPAAFGRMYGVRIRQSFLNVKRIRSTR